MAELGRELSLLDVALGSPPRSPPRRSFASPHAGTSFLDLPHDIRCRVYRLAGLVRPSSINFDDPSDNGCSPLPTQLLYVCHIMYEECSTMLYSENKFDTGMSLWPTDGLSVLERMSAATFSRLTSIAIGLSVRGTFYDSDYEIQKSDALERWDKTCRRLLSHHLEPGRLSLALFFPSGTYAEAWEVLKPLTRPTLPALRACSVSLRLDNFDNSPLRRQLRDLAWTTAAGAIERRIDRPEGPNRLPVLPDEIISLIIRHVVAADVPVVYGADNEFKCCRRCSDMPWFCFCAHNKRVVSFSTTCTCSLLLFSAPIFRLSKAWREEAIRLFYHNTRFVVVANFGAWSRPNVEGLLQLLRPGTVNLIRKIELNVPYRAMFFQLHYSSPSAANTTYEGWQRQLEILASAVPMGMLQLTLTAMGEEEEEEDRDESEEEDEDKVRHRQAVYYDFMRRVVHLVSEMTSGKAGRPRDFFVHLRWEPDAHTRDEWEARFEQVVMGDKYNARARGKPEQPKNYD